MCTGRALHHHTWQPFNPKGPIAGILCPSSLSAAKGQTLVARCRRVVSVWCRIQKIIAGREAQSLVPSAPTVFRAAVYPDAWRPALPSAELFTLELYCCSARNPYAAFKK